MPTNNHWNKPSWKGVSIGLCGIAAAICFVCVRSRIELTTGSNREQYEFVFIGEDGRPIPQLQLYLYETDHGHFRNAIFRDFLLDANATIKVNSLPSEFILGVQSHADFYHMFWNGNKETLSPIPPALQDGSIAIHTGANSIRLCRFGAAQVSFTSVGQDVRGSNGGVPVLAYYRRQPSGEFLFAGGIGTAPRIGKVSRLFGLPEGIYRFELKPDYESNITFFRSTEIVIANGTLVDVVGVATSHHK